jgi:hypothetical protein
MGPCYSYSRLRQALFEILELSSLPSQLYRPPACVLPGILAISTTSGPILRFCVAIAIKQALIFRPGYARISQRYTGRLLCLSHVPATVGPPPRQTKERKLVQELRFLPQQTGKLYSCILAHIHTSLRCFRQLASTRFCSQEQSQPRERPKPSSERYKKEGN